MLLCENGTFDVYECSSLLRCAFDSAFNTSEIKAGFRRAVLYPLDPDGLLNMLRPEHDEEASDLVTLEQLRLEMSKQRAAVRISILGDDATFV